VTSLSSELLKGFFQINIFRKIMIKVSFFINSFTVFKERLTLKIDSAAPGGGERKLIFFEMRHPVALSYNYYVNKESQLVLTLYLHNNYMII
jgi:hypothetical protein